MIFKHFNQYQETENGSNTRPVSCLFEQIWISLYAVAYK